MFKFAKISEYKIKKIIKYFVINIIVAKTALLPGINRNTINHWYLVFRKAVYAHQMGKFEKIIRETEIDESYFGALIILCCNRRLKLRLK